MNYIKITLGIFGILAASRFVPHPPNFTSLIALSFYVPVLLGNRYIPALIVCFAITDLFIGFHSVTLFTWGSVLLIGLLSKYFTNGILYRISGALAGCCIFFIVSNFGVWSQGIYGYNIQGLTTCYVLALPFFGYSLISTFLFSGIIESICKINIIKNYLKLIKN
tara:strand:- start:61 stop:555 length:495 start_codon:yes stop_codon:yes gene_type:complete